MRFSMVVNGNCKTGVGLLWKFVVSDAADEKRLKISCCECIQLFVEEISKSIKTLDERHVKNGWFSVEILKQYVV